MLSVLTPFDISYGDAVAAVVVDDMTSLDS
jgi:hypothetical protein